jgi:hypothetical protein
MRAYAAGRLITAAWKFDWFSRNQENKLAMGAGLVNLHGFRRGKGAAAKF